MKVMRRIKDRTYVLVATCSGDNLRVYKYKNNKR